VVRGVSPDSASIKIIKEARKKVPYTAMLLEYTFFKDYNEDLIYTSIRRGKKAILW